MNIANLTQPKVSIYFQLTSPSQTALKLLEQSFCNQTHQSGERVPGTDQPPADIDDFTEKSGSFISRRVSRLMKPSTVEFLAENCSLLAKATTTPQDLDEAEYLMSIDLLCWIDFESMSTVLLGSDHTPNHKLRSHYALKGEVGIRTCQSVESHTGPAHCVSCPLRNQYQTPAFIQAKDVIESIGDSFYETVITKTGERKKTQPDYEGLAKHYQNLHPYMAMRDTGISYKFSDTHWVDVFNSELKAFAREHFDPKPGRNKRTEFLELMKIINLKNQDWFGHTTQAKINLQNGMFDVQTGQLLPSSHHYGFRYVLPYEHDPDATCPRFEKFLWEITLGREDLQKILLEFMGYSLSGDNYWAQKALVLLGSGANGKSTFMDTLKHLAGRDNYAAKSLGELNDWTNRYDLDGRLFNISEEAGLSSLNESDVFKRMVGGNELTAKRLYSQPYSFTNRAKLILSCNELPKSGDKTHGLYRRMLIVPFDAKFEGEDKDSFIQQKLDAELPGIFNLVVSAYGDLQARGKFVGSVVTDKMLADYQEENDNMIYWRNEKTKTIVDDAVHLIEYDESFESSDRIYNDYVRFTRDNNQKPLSRIQFFRRFQNVFPFSKKVQRRVMNKPTRGYKGIELDSII